MNLLPPGLKEAGEEQAELLAPGECPAPRAMVVQLFCDVPRRGRINKRGGEGATDRKKPSSTTRGGVLRGQEGEVGPLISKRRPVWGKKRCQS